MLSAKFFHETADLFVLLIDFTETPFGGFGILAEGDSQNIHPIEIVFGSDFFNLSDDIEIMGRWLHGITNLKLVAAFPQVSSPVRHQYPRHGGAE